MLFCYCSYCLLGASGCGKTTLLSTIVGLKKMDKGQVSVFGGIPGDRKIGISGRRIGYMPQVICNELLTIDMEYGSYS